MAITNIIFDLGGVLLNLDFGKTREAFTGLGVKNFDEYFTQYHAHPLFRQLETGQETGTGFYDSLRETAFISASNEEIDAAWNAMLLDFPMERIQKLQELSKRYRLFLFSNTNAIHHASFHTSFQKNFGFHFDMLFEQAFYSHVIGYRKPDIRAFEYVLKVGGMKAGDTLFLDDTLPNIEAAAMLGIRTGLVSEEKDIIRVLEEGLD